MAEKYWRPCPACEARIPVAEDRCLRCGHDDPLDPADRQARLGRLRRSTRLWQIATVLAVAGGLWVIVDYITR